jgi:hypothetical protein
MRHPHPVQNLLAWTKERGRDRPRKAPLPVDCSHNTHTYLLRFRCGGLDRADADRAHQAEWYRSHTSLPCIPPRGGNERLGGALVGVRHTASAGTEDDSGVWRRDEEGRVEGTGDALGIGQQPCAFVPAGLVPVQAIPKDHGGGQELFTSGTVDVVGVCSVLHRTLRSCGSLEPGGGAWKLRQYRASHQTCNYRIHRGDDGRARAWEFLGVGVLPWPGQ